jgi:hypothetical protein
LPSTSLSICARITTVVFASWTRQIDRALYPPLAMSATVQAPDDIVVIDLPDEKERRSRSFPTTACVALSLPLVVMMGQMLASPVQMPGGDLALIESATREAMGFNQIDGPYSRYGWHHFGPMYFYIQAVFSFFIGNAHSLYVCSIALNLLPALAAVALTWKVIGRNAALWTSISCSVLLLQLTPERLRNPWNPDVLIMPTLLFLVACALSPRSRVALMTAAITGSFLAQTHVTIALLVGVGLVVAGVSHLIALRNRRALLSILFGLALTTLLWTPTIIEAAQSGESNISMVKTFAEDAKPDHETGDVVQRMAQALWEPSDLVSSEYSSGGLVLRLGGFGLLIAGALAIAIRRRQLSAVMLVAMTVLAFVAATASTFRTFGELLPYLVLWVAAVGTAAVIAFGWSVISERSRRFDTLATGVAVIIGVVLLVSVLRLPDASWLDDKAVRSAMTTLERDPQLLTRSDQPVLVDIRTHEMWALAAGVVNELQRDGYKTVVTQQWHSMFDQPVVNVSRPHVHVELWTAADFATQGRSDAVFFGGNNEFALVVK